MPITLNYQPSAQAVGNAANAAGAESLRRYEQSQALAQQQLAQQAALQREGYANQQYLQGQQLDYNSRAAALGVLANQTTQSRGFNQQTALQNDAQQSAAQLQDQRLQYDYQNQQNQIANQQYLQQQNLGAQFAQQYLQGQQNSGLSYQNYLQSADIQQQKLNFDLYSKNAQEQAEVNKLQQNRARIEQMRATGQLNAQQYAAADAEIKARELGLSRTLPQQKNTSLLEELNQALVQHPQTGQWFQKDPSTGAFEPVQQPQQQQDQMKVQQNQAEQKQQQTMRSEMVKMYMDQLKLNSEPGSPKPDPQEIYNVISSFYNGMQAATPTQQIPGMGSQTSSLTTPGLQQYAAQFATLMTGSGMTPEQAIPKLREAYFDSLPLVRSDAEYADLKPGQEYRFVSEGRIKIGVKK